MDDRLTKLRKEVDKIDENILELLGKRFAVTKKVGKLKKEAKIGVIDQKRWISLLDKNLSHAKKMGIPVTLVKKIYQLIHLHSVKLQKEL